MFARHLLLAALLLRALLPLGWMPGSVQLGQSAWIICTADGQIQHGAPGKNDTTPQHEPCAFAVAHVLAAPDSHGFVAPVLQTAQTDTGVAVEAIHAATRFTPQSPRAPPIFA